MSGLSPWTGWGVAVGAACVGVVSGWFYRRQRRGALGGQMSLAKGLWLNFAVTYWFVVCPLLALSQGFGQPWRFILWTHSAHWWARGVIELVMLYGTKSWRPRYGIAHDVLSLLWVCGCAWLCAPAAGVGDGPYAAVGAAAVAALALSLCLEIGYAWAFNQLVRGRTTGDDGVWFADAQQALFRRVNRVTAAFNVPLYLGLGALVGWSLWRSLVSR
jgi:hypothetical protein